MSDIGMTARIDPSFKMIGTYKINIVIIFSGYLLRTEIDSGDLQTLVGFILYGLSFNIPGAAINNSGRIGISQASVSHKRETAVPERQIAGTSSETDLIYIGYIPRTDNALVIAF